MVIMMIKMADGTVILSKEERKRHRKDYKNAEYIVQMTHVLKYMQKCGDASDATVWDLIVPEGKEEYGRYRNNIKRFKTRIDDLAMSAL